MDLLVLSVRAGLTPFQAVRELARSADPIVRDGFGEVIRRTERGQPFADALNALPEQLGTPAVALADVIATSDRHGLPLGTVLDQLTTETRATRRRLEQAEARKLPVRLSFPLVVCTLAIVRPPRDRARRARRTVVARRNRLVTRPTTPIPNGAVMPNLFALAMFVRLHTTAISALPTGRSRLAPGDDRGQATTEYALVLLAAALVGLMVVAWATAGGGAARISRLFNSVIDAVIDRI